MRLRGLCLALLILATVHAEEPKEAESVVVVEAKEVDGQAVAEDRSNAVYLDQLAVESIDRSQTVYVQPPSNTLHGAIPVPVSLASKPGSLVLPGLPQHAPHRRPGGHFGGHQPRRNSLPRRPPPPVNKRPFPVRTNYAPPPVLVQRKFVQPHSTFVPPPLPVGFSVPPVAVPGRIPQSVLRPQRTASGQLPIQVQREPNYSLPPPPQSSPSISHQPPPQSNLQATIFGDPKNNDLLQKSESSISTAYSGPPPPVPSGGYHGPGNQLGVSQEHVLPSYGESRQPILNSGSNTREGGGFTNSYQEPGKQLSVSQEYVPPSYGEGRQPILNSVDNSREGNSFANSYVPPTAVGPAEPWPVTAPDMPNIVALDVKCEKNLMKVRIEFDKPFNGIIFSKGHYSNVHCVHLPAGLGRTHSTFDVSINSCGTTGNTENGLYGYGSQSGSGTYFENTIVVQYDPQVQEVWDQARKLRCTWHDQYEKSVTFRPFSVDMLDVVRADFAGDNVGCWMQIQVGKGPWASEVSGLVKIGQTMTMVLAIKDDDNKFDMLVRNCMAHDGKRAPIQLVDQRGCITRPKLMSRFTKIKDFGASASVLSYAHFQAFKFPDSMEVHFQCTIQICRYQCPEQCTEGSSQGYSGGGAISPRDHRKKRELSDSVEEPDSEEQADIGVNRVIQVVSTRDLTFVLDKNGSEAEEMREVTKETLISSGFDDHDGLICMSTPGFAATLVVLLGILIVSCLLSAFLCLRYRSVPNARSLISSYENPAFLRKQGAFEYQ